jgi:predicted SpoU family rRNA methylase
MAQKDLIIGVFSNYKYDDVKPWVKSSKDCGFEGDVVLIGINIDDETADAIEKDGVIVVRARKHSPQMIHMERFLHIYDFLKHNEDAYRYVISTDVRDVIFQKDPTKWMEYVGIKGIVSSGEAILIKDEEWNRNNIVKNFGEHFYQDIMDYPVQCVGVLAGVQDKMKDLCFYLYQMSLNRPDWVADQAAYNMIVHTGPWSDLTYFAELDDAWAINGHVTNYEKDMAKFEPYLLEGRPYIEDGKIVNEFGEEFYIVHQYDRVREWKKIYEDMYGVKINSQYTPDNDLIVINTGV